MCASHDPMARQTPPFRSSIWLTLRQIGSTRQLHGVAECPPPEPTVHYRTYRTVVTLAAALRLVAAWPLCARDRDRRRLRPASGCRSPARRTWGRVLEDRLLPVPPLFRASPPSRRPCPFRSGRWSASAACLREENETECCDWWRPGPCA